MEARCEAIFIGAGANLPHPAHGSPRETLTAAFEELSRRDVEIRRLSPWYSSAPVPQSDQPWYVNVVAELSTPIQENALLALLHDVERSFGRVRSVPNAARVIDLDLLDYCGKIASGGPGLATLPHPRMAERAFVLRPLADLAPGWRHPVTGASIVGLVAALSGQQVMRQL